MSPQKGVTPEPNLQGGALQILFSSHISVGNIFTGEAAAIATPGTGTLLARVWKLSFKMERPDAEIAPIKRNICAGKVLRCSLFFKIYYYNNTIPGKKSHDIISVIWEAEAAFTFAFHAASVCS